MSIVAVLSGVPGSGKTTEAKAYIASLKKGSMTGLSSIIVSADDYFMKDGKYEYDGREIGNAHADCFRKFIRHLAAGTDVIVVDNTNIGVEEIAPYMLGASAFGYEATLYTIMCEPGIAYRRNTHDLQQPTIQSMHDRLVKRHLPPYWQENEYWPVGNSSLTKGE